MLQNPIMENNLRYELVRPIPRLKKILRYNPGQGIRFLAESTVCHRATARAPWIQIITVFENVLVKQLRQIVNEDPAVFAISAVNVGGGDGDGREAVELLVSGGGKRWWERKREIADGEEEEDLKEEDYK